MRKKYTYEYVYNYFKDHGCELLDIEYINSETKLKYKCKCGNISYIRFQNFKFGQRCIKCGIKKSSINKSYKFEFIYNYFKEQGCELLEYEYINNTTKMKYKCKCQNVSYITFSHFKNGVRCKKCFSFNMSGKNHPRYIKDRQHIKIINKLRKKFERSWIINNMKHDPLYQEFLLNPKLYSLDHIIPIAIFRDIVIEYNLNPEEIREIINQRDNLQLLTRLNNSKKHSKGNIFEASQYLMLNGIKLFKRN